jgi:hypothetical protein
VVGGIGSSSKMVMVAVVLRRVALTTCDKTKVNETLPEYLLSLMMGIETVKVVVGYLKTRSPLVAS